MPGSSSVRSSSSMKEICRLSRIWSRRATLTNISAIEPRSAACCWATWIVVALTALNAPARAPSSSVEVTGIWVRENCGPSPGTRTCSTSSGSCSRTSPTALVRRRSGTTISRTTSSAMRTESSTATRVAMIVAVARWTARCSFPAAIATFRAPSLSRTVVISRSAPSEFSWYDVGSIAVTALALPEESTRRWPTYASASDPSRMPLSRTCASAVRAWVYASVSKVILGASSSTAAGSPRPSAISRNASGSSRASPSPDRFTRQYAFRRLASSRSCRASASTAPCSTWNPMIELYWLSMTFPGSSAPSTCLRRAGRLWRASRVCETDCSTPGPSGLTSIELMADSRRAARRSVAARAASRAAVPAAGSWASARDSRRSVCNAWVKAPTSSVVPMSASTAPATLAALIACHEMIEAAPNRTSTGTARAASTFPRMPSLCSIASPLRHVGRDAPTTSPAQSANGYPDRAVGVPA